MWAFSTHLHREEPVDLRSSLSPQAPIPCAQGKGHNQRCPRAILNYGELHADACQTLMRSCNQYVVHLTLVREPPDNPTAGCLAPDPRCGSLIPTADLQLRCKAHQHNNSICAFSTLYD